MEDAHRGAQGDRRIAGGNHAGRHQRPAPATGQEAVLITGPHGFERTVTFAIHDDPAVIAERVRETLEE